MSWTERDEENLNGLIAKKAAYVSANRDCVLRATDQVFHRGMSSDELVDALIELATTFRKVLEPFDKEFVK